MSMDTINYFQSAEYHHQTSKSEETKLDEHFQEKQQQEKQHVCESTHSTTTTQEANCTSKPKLQFNEADTIRQVRLRTLSHWPHANPSRDMMAQNGWFSCNISDRVMCIYCNTICHNWTRHDDPAEVHSRLAPHCPFNLTLSKQGKSYAVVNDRVKDKFEPYHLKMAEISRRQATFTKELWTLESPNVEDLVRCGFFYSGMGNVVTCFYCNGSLHKWSGNDSPMIEHARWFPTCLYAKHLCGDELHQKIQISNKRVSKENKIDKNQLSRLVAARLDLPTTVLLRSQYSLSIIKRCIEDQLRIKNDDFVSDMDLIIACLLLKKQIDTIKGCQDNILTPSSTTKKEASSSTPKRSLGECVICLTEEKQLACMPCGHFCACVPCGYSLKTCPMCREKIDSFVRINV